MSKTLTKKELRAPDSFQEIAGRMAKWTEANITVLVGLAIAIIFISMAWIGYGYYTKFQEGKAEAALFPVQDQLIKTILTNKEAPIQIKDYVDVLKDHSHQNAAALSAVQVIGALATRENTESLQKEIMTSVSLGFSQNTLTTGFWKLTEGQVLARNGELAAAKQAYKDVIQESKLKEFHPKALLELGALSEKEGDLKGARDFYSRVAREFPDSEARKMADKLLIHIDLLGEPSSGS